jgi:hypothetical protein
VGLLYILTLWSNVCVIWTLDLIVVLWPDIINGVGHPRPNSVMLLVLYMVAYNIRGTSIVL